jgi:large subunit ribosomal protein L1
MSAILAARKCMQQLSSSVALRTVQQRSTVLASSAQMLNAGFCVAAAPQSQRKPHNINKVRTPTPRLPRRDDGRVRHNKGKGSDQIKKTYDKGLNIYNAIDEVKENSWVRFDEGIDLAIQLNVDPRKPNQAIRGVAKLPHGSGRLVRVAVFASGPDAAKAKEAGADIVGAEDLAAIIQSGTMEFDSLIATPEMMGMVGKLGRILGPRGLMPNPKLGTVTKNVAEAVKESKAGAIQFRVEKKGIIHCGIGRISFTSDKLLDNIRSVMVAISEAKPEGLKGSYFKQVMITSSMGPSVPVDLPNVDPSSMRFMLKPEEIV